MPEELQSRLSRTPSGFSKRDLIMVIAMLVLASVGLILMVAWMARRSLTPFLLVEPGQSVEEVVKIVGEPKYRTESLSLIRDRSESESFACMRLGSSLPGLLKPIFPAASTTYGPWGEVPLPEVTGKILVFFPFLYEVLIYVDADHQVETVLYCCT